MLSCFAANTQALFCAWKNLLPSKFAKRMVGAGRRPRSSTAASVARFAIKSWGTSIGSAEPPSDLSPFVLAPTPYRKRKSRSCIIAIRLTCSLLTCAVLLTSCCRSISTAGKSKSITAKRKILWVSVKLNCGMLPRCPNNPSWQLPPIAPCCWLLFKPLAQSAAPPMPSYPSGGEMLAALPVWTSLPYCAKK